MSNEENNLTNRTPLLSAEERIKQVFEEMRGIGFDSQVSHIRVSEWADRLEVQIRRRLRELEDIASARQEEIHDLREQVEKLEDAAARVITDTTSVDVSATPPASPPSEGGSDAPSAPEVATSQNGGVA